MFFALTFFLFCFTIYKSMKSLEVAIEKLNTLSLEISPIIGNTKFYFGDTFTKAEEIICKLIPFGKAVLLCSEGDYHEKGKILEKNLTEKGIKCQILINPSLKDFDRIVENVRLVISFSNEFFNLAGMLATERKLYSLFIVDKFNFDSILTIETELNGKKISLNFDRRILLDVDRLIKDEEGSSLEYAFIMSKLISLVDYRIYGIITGEGINKSAYSLIKSAVEETYSIFSKGREEYLILLLKNAIVVRLADAFTNASFIKSSATDLCVMLDGDKKAYIPYAKKLAKIYAITFSSAFDGVSEPDYLERLERVLKYCNGSEVKLSKWIVYQGSLCKKMEKEILLIKELLFNEVLGYIKIFDKVEKTYFALGGNSISVNNEIIKVCGDFLGAFNGMTLATNAGIGEYL